MPPVHNSRWADIIYIKEMSESNKILYESLRVGARSFFGFRVIQLVFEIEGYDVMVTFA